MPKSVQGLYKTELLKPREANMFQDLQLTDGVDDARKFLSLDRNEKSLRGEIRSTPLGDELKQFKRINPYLGGLVGKLIADERNVLNALIGEMESMHRTIIDLSARVRAEESVVVDLKRNIEARQVSPDYGPQIGMLRDEILQQRKDINVLLADNAEQRNRILSLSMDIHESDASSHECSIRLEELAKRIDKQYSMCQGMAKEVDRNKRQSKEMEILVYEHSATLRYMENEDVAKEQQLNAQMEHIQQKLAELIQEKQEWDEVFS
jgi:chromosome segregation ATPase